jgi:hypothetical protein
MYDAVVWQLDGSYGSPNFPKVKICEEAEFRTPAGPGLVGLARTRGQ